MSTEYCFCDPTTPEEVVYRWRAVGIMSGRTFRWALGRAEVERVLHEGESLLVRDEYGRTYTPAEFFTILEGAHEDEAHVGRNDIFNL